MNFERYTSSNCIIKIENILKIEVGQKDCKALYMLQRQIIVWTFVSEALFLFLF